MHIQLAHGALQPLIDESVKHRSAVIAESGPLVGVNREPMRHVDVEATQTRLNSLDLEVLSNNLINLWYRHINISTNNYVVRHFKAYSKNNYKE